MTTPEHNDKQALIRAFRTLKNAFAITAEEPLPVASSGASISIIHTEIEINALTWTELSGAGLLTRNTLAVQIRAEGVDGLSPVMLNGDNSTIGYHGAEVLEGNERVYDMKQVKIYAKSKTGTFKVTIEELS